MSDVSIVEMEADQNLSDFEAHNPVKSSAAVSQPAIASHCEVNQSFTDMEVCSNGSISKRYYCSAASRERSL